ncbi:MAG: glycosyltransferase family 4 protein [Planctomycetota bacterium]|nr:glycosyltransferase family 4 protein [Planctomycetota bacterium]
MSVTTQQNTTMTSEGLHLATKESTMTHSEIESISDSKGKGHVLILVENLPVPFDRRTWMEALALRDAGYTVSVISPAPPDDSAPFRVIEGIQVYRYSAPNPTRGKLSFVREFAYCYLQTKRLVRKVWRINRFDVIHSCNPPDMFWAIARTYKKHGVKFVFDHHDVCPELYLSKFGREDFFYKGLCWLERKQYETADAVIATNESYRDIAISRGGKQLNEVTVVRSGPMLSRFKPTMPVPDLKRGRKYLVVYLGVMGPQDGVDYALRAIAEAIEQGLEETTFAFIGGGDSYEDLVELSQRLGLQDHVEFTGRIPDEQLREYLSTADLGLAPDPKNPLNDVSSMNKIVEYMAMSLPVLSFDLRESRRTAGQAAAYVPDNDERQYAKVMIELLHDLLRRQTMGSTGRERVEMRLAWEHSARFLIEMYDHLLNNENHTMQISSFEHDEADDLRRAA